MTAFQPLPIRFRAWDRKAKEWISLHDIVFGRKGQPMKVGARTNEIGWIEEYDVDQMILSRYCGMWNGKELWEYDYVEGEEWFFPMNMKTRKISKKKKTVDKFNGVVLVHNGTVSLGSYPLALVDPQRLKVIGNILEQPELLERLNKKNKGKYNALSKDLKRR